jgi:predicted Zn-dependent protease
MKNSMDEEFQNALEEHKKGNQQSASRLYQGILNIVPSHPDANHNLGLILETNGKAKLALPLFKNALEASPSTELFWLSYINSLIENQDISNAFEVIEQSRQMG